MGLSSWTLPTPRETAKSGDWFIFRREDAFYRETVGRKLGTRPLCVETLRFSFAYPLDMLQNPPQLVA